MEQGLVVGARVEHKEYGEGVIVEVVDESRPYLVHFDNWNKGLHHGGKPHKYPDEHMWWCYLEKIKLVKPAHEAHKTESQQLVDILVQLGFVKQETSFNYDYIGDKLNVFWDDGYYSVFNKKIKKRDSRCNKICGESLATNIAYFQKKLNKKLKKAAAKQASQSQVEVAIVEEQKVSKPKPDKLMKLPQINWTNRIANYDMVMEELRKNEFRPSKSKELSGFYYWKYNPDLMVYVGIYCWDIMNDDNEKVFSKLTEFGSVDKFRSELAKALKATPKRFKLKKDFQ